MRVQAIAALLIASIGFTQTAVAQTQAPGPSAPTPDTAAPAAQTSGMLTVPVGTVIPLTLVTPIMSLSTHVGDAVRAQVAFPVTVGSHVAIPPGTYVEGTLQLIKLNYNNIHQSTVEIHFTKLIFATGYTVPFNAQNSYAMVDFPNLFPDQKIHGTQDGTVMLAANEGMSIGNMHSSPMLMAMSLPAAQAAPALRSESLPAATTSPTLNTGNNIPSPAEVSGIIGGIFAGTLVVGILLLRHAGKVRKNTDLYVHNPGWQLQVTLSTPLTLDPSQIGTYTGAPTN